MQAIVAVDKRWGIGYNKNLLVSIPGDKKNFRKLTTGKTIIVGRKTLESFPNGLPLSDRTNIVVTRKKNYDAHGAIVVSSPEEAYKKALEISAEDDIFVVGGGEIYAQLIDKCDTAIVTKINYTYTADTYFPNLDEDDRWECVDESEEMTCFDMEYVFCTYKRK